MTGIPRDRAMGDHRLGRLPHAEQAHLGEVVEAVLVDDRDVRAGAVERTRPFALRRRDHGIEERRRVTARSQIGCGVQGAERGVWLLRPPQLGVEAQVIRLAEEHLTHGRLASRSAAAHGRRHD